MMKMKYINKDKSYIIRIKNSNEYKMIQFCVIKFEYERNHEFVRQIENK